MSEDEEPAAEPARRRAPAGNPHGDIQTALRDGWDSHLIEIEDIEGQRLFTRWMNRAAARGDSAGFILFKDSDDGPRRTYRLAFGSQDVVGTLELEKWDGRWLIIGARSLETRDEESDRVD